MQRGGAGLDRIVAGWGVQLADALQSILEAASEEELERLVQPFVAIDLGGAAGIGFCPPGAAELRANRVLTVDGRAAWAEHGEPAIVHLIGMALRRLAPDLDESAATTRPSWPCARSPPPAASARSCASTAWVPTALGEAGRPGRMADTGRGPRVCWRGR